MWNTRPSAPHISCLTHSFFPWPLTPFPVIDPWWCCNSDVSPAKAAIWTVHCCQITRKGTLIITLETQWNSMKAEVKQLLFLPHRFYKTIQINHLEKPSTLIILRVLQAVQGNNDEWIPTSMSVRQPSSKKGFLSSVYLPLINSATGEDFSFSIPIFSTFYSLPVFQPNVRSIKHVIFGPPPGVPWHLW